SSSSKGGTYIRPQKNTKARIEPLCLFLCAFVALRTGFQRQVRHVVASLDQDECGFRSGLSDRGVELSKRFDRLPVDFLNQVARTNTFTSGVACWIHFRHQQSLIVSIETVARSHFRSKRLEC